MPNAPQALLWYLPLPDTRGCVPEKKRNHSEKIAENC